MKKLRSFYLPLLLFFLSSDNLLALSNSFRIKVGTEYAVTPAYRGKCYNSNNWENFDIESWRFDHRPKSDYFIRVQDTVIWQVGDTYVNGQVLGRLKCLQVKSAKKERWDYITAPILGFDYEEGYTYTIKVKQTKAKNADSTQYELLDIISKKRVTALPSVASFLARFKWNLLQLNGKDVSSSRASIGFDAKNGTVAGSTGCNKFWGDFTIMGDRISFTHLASTMRACSGASIENDFFAVVEQRQIQFDIAEQTLNLYLDGKLVMIFGLERG